MTKESSQYVTLLTLLLKGAVIANFEYWSEFIIRIQRDEAKRSAKLNEWFGERRIPSLICLRLRGKWWIGEQVKWLSSVEQFPMKADPPMPVETALQASTLIMLLDNEILDVSVNEHGDLALVLSDGRVMTAEGANEEWEESWFLELPIDDPDRDQWSIICDSQGRITGRFPSAVNA